MSRRLDRLGRLIDRTRPRLFRFDGRDYTGYEGDTLASALLANDQMMMGRSFKYHRPRGVVAAGAEEPNALLGLGEGARFEPNQRATTTELFDGAVMTSQNRWPSLRFDIGVLNDWFARFLPSGFYYKTFMAPRAAWKHVFEPIVRQSAGLGRVPVGPDADRYEHAYDYADVVIAGGGVAGLQAALEAGRKGQRVIVMEQTPHWGGRSPVDGGTIEGQPVAEWIEAVLGTLSDMPNVTLRRRTQVSGLYDHGYVLGYERLTDHAPMAGGPRHRLWRVRAGKVVVATGAIERPISFVGNDVPGVMLASALRDYLVNWAVAPGDSVVVVTTNDDGYRSAITAYDAGLRVPVVLDTRPEPGELAAECRLRGIRVLADCGIAKVHGRSRVSAVDICAQSGSGEVIETLVCDAIAMSGGWSPVVHLWSHCGGKLSWDEGQGMFRPDPSRPPKGDQGQPMAECVGAANGDLTLAQIMDAVPEAAPMPVWMMPAQAPVKKRGKMFLDYQNDVKVSDVQLAAREGYQSVEHTKRYTTLGMATDQGKLSNINGLAVLSKALDQEIPATGTTTFRPPYTPISLGAIAGEARGSTFQPLRRTPIHDWHDARGAVWEPVGHWRRPYSYPRAGETVPEAVNREISATRNGVGMLDASTLGKILVKGPDAGRFLNMIYTNMMSSLGVGKCRYGLMCNDNGFLMDDGVVARISEDEWLCHTTTGGADRIHAHMEDWLQCEWWDWKVYTANLTEQFAQIAVVGPKSRELLHRLGGMSLTAEALPFMHWIEGELAGIPVRVFRISFSGELSFEIAAPADRGLELWEKLMAEGHSLGVTPYGTEALHVMRAEKGFIMIGDETDGTVIPQDLGLNWAISKKKEDFLGKRAQSRSHMADPDRWKLVGLETLDGSVLPDGALALDEGRNANGQQKTQGRVTSSYHSPTLGKGIAMGLVRHGPDRMGEVLTFALSESHKIKARICDPVFYDKEGAKQNV